MNKRTLLFLPFVALGALAGCKKGGADIVENQINVKMYLGGYGKDWMEAVVNQFNEAYKDENIKVNLLTPSSTNQGTGTLNELKRGYNKHGVDLFFTANLSPSQLFDPDTGVTEADMTPLDELVYDKHALKFDKGEEVKTVREKLDKSFGDEWYKYNGKTYGFFYQKSVGAIAVNKYKLKTILGDDVKLPVTTDEFLDQLHTLALKELNGETCQKPICYVGAAQNGYPAVMTYNLYTQYSGIDNWNTFWSLNNADGSKMTKDQARKMFDTNNVGLHESAKVVYEVLEPKHLVKGSTDTSYDISKAHGALMSEMNKEGGVYMFDGDWILNECAIDYEKDLDKLEFLNVPVISALGTKLWGDKGLNGTDIDTLLARTIRLIDDNKETAEIISTIELEFGVTITESDVNTVAKARGVYCNRGQQTGTVYVPSGMTDLHKDIISKFLRTIASDDFGGLYYDKARCFSPYCDSSVITSATSEFAKGHMRIVNNKNATSIWPIATGFRKQISALGNIFPNTGSNNLLHFKAATQTDYLDGYIKDAAVYHDNKYHLNPDYKAGYESAKNTQINKDISEIDKNWEKWTEGKY